MSFYTEKCCYLATKCLTGTMQQRRLFLAYSRFVLEQFHYMQKQIINEKISVAFSPTTARTRNTQKHDMFGRQRKKQEGQQCHQYEVANNYVFKCRLKVDSDDDD